MPFEHPGHEHVALTAYERRQFELIALRLASADRQSGAHRADTEAIPAKPLWIAVVIICAGIALLGVIAASALLALVGSAIAGIAFVMHCRSRHGPGTNG